MNAINVVNTALCIMIVLLGYWGYMQHRQKALLIIGLAFGLFGVSHVVKMAGLETSWMNAMIITRTAGYLLVVLALWMFATKRTGG